LEVYRKIEDFKKLSCAVVTTGTYDGVHKGHRKILSRLVEISKECDGESVVITFWPHPRKILSETQGNEVKVLSTIEEKIQLLAELKIDHLLVIPFTREFSELSSEDFIKKILVDKIGTKKLVIGYDHKFGKNREGSFDHLKKESSHYGFEVEEISRQDIDAIGVSSTEIRKALAMGDVKKAATYLTQPYSISGLIVKGQQLGRTIGFPTANINISDPEKLIPQDGVYAVLVKYKETIYKGMLNIGNRPTIDGKHKTVEVNIFDFDKEIYGESLEVKFIDYLRSEVKFSGIDALKEQLKKDKEKSIELLK
jgi:riboflavin kinase/FMN adenylyltransferase